MRRLRRKIKLKCETKRTSSGRAKAARASRRRTPRAPQKTSARVSHPQQLSRIKRASPQGVPNATSKPTRWMTISTTIARLARSALVQKLASQRAVKRTTLASCNRAKSAASRRAHLETRQRATTTTTKKLRVATMQTALMKSRASLVKRGMLERARQRKSASDS